MKINTFMEYIFKRGLDILKKFATRLNIPN